MPTASTTLTAEETNPPSDARVLDSGRVLGVMATGVLAAGVVALSMLAGDADAPKVEALVDEAPIAQPAPETRDDTIHRLRPQTSATLPTADGPNTMGSLPGSTKAWDYSPVAPFAPLDKVDPSETDVAQKPGLLR